MVPSRSSTKFVHVALTTKAIAISKHMAAAMTGSSAVLAEASHPTPTPGSVWSAQFLLLSLSYLAPGAIEIHQSGHSCRSPHVPAS